MIPWFQEIVWHIGPIPIQVWGFFVALGMILSLAILRSRARAFDLTVEPILDLAFKMIFFGIIFARLFHVFFYEPAFFLAHPLEIFQIWHGGLSSFGGLFGAGVAFFLLWKKGNSPVSILKRADLFSFAALFGWIVGRIGCVMIHDHLGKPCDCFLAIQTPDGIPRLEMSILEIIGLLPLAILFFLFRKRIQKEGWFTAILLGYYGFLRFVLDFWRATDIPGADQRYLGLTPAQYASIVIIVLAVVIYRKKGRIA